MYSQNFAGTNDWEIITSILQTGNSELFSELYRRHINAIQKKCFSIVKNRIEAHELAQEIFTIAFEKLSTFRNSSLFSTWLYSITVNHCLQYLKSKQKQAQFVLVQECLNITDEEYDDQQDMLIALLASTLELLPANDRQLFDLRFNQNLPIKEICARLGKNESAVKMKIKRLKAQLVNLMANATLSVS